MEKKISVIISCYNVEKYIERCIDSIINQTIGLDSLELIFVNDASEDKTLEILLEYEKRYEDSVIVINCLENGRQGTARNIGLKYANGKYIGFVDSDDWIEPDMYELLYEKAEKYKCDIVHCRMIRDYGKIKYEREKMPDDSLIIIENDEERSEFIASAILGVGPCDKIYKRSLIFDNNICFPEKIAYEDISWGAMFYLYAARIYIVEKRLYHYFVNTESTVLNMNKEYHMDIFKANMIKWQEYIERGALERYKEAVEYDFISTYFLGGLKMLFLRFTESKYNEFVIARNTVLELIPLYAKNKYLDKYTDEKYKVLLDLLYLDINEDDFSKVKELFLKLI